MKIALLLASLEEGGLENHVVDLANGLVEHGDAVTLLSDPKFFDRCAPGVVGTAIDASASRHNLLNRARTRAAILASGAQIVHAHAGKAAAILAQSAKALKKAGVRTVSTIHGLKGSLKNYASCDHVIGVSHGVVERLPSGTPSTVVYNGVSAPPDVERSHDELATLLGADASRPISIAVGRLVPVKGYDRLIDAWQDAFGTLAIMGEGPQETALREQARGKSIVFTGYRSDVRSWYSGADLMVFSSNREGFSYAMAEALRARLPIVSTEVPGAREILPPELLASPTTLGETIDNALRDLDHTRALSRPVFDWAAQTLTADAMVSSVREVYSRLTADG